MTLNHHHVPNDPAHVADHNEIADIVQNQDTLANRPAPGVVGRVYKATDTGQIFREDGAAWTELATPSTISTSIAALIGQANVWAGKNTWSGDGYFASGRPWVDVMATPYNAAGNNAGDDSAAFSSAMLAVSNQGGGVVYAPRGTYVCLSGLNGYGLRSVVLRGASPTPLYNKPGTMIKYSGAGVLSRFVDFRSSAYCGIENIGFYNVTNANTGWMIDFSEDFGGPTDQEVFGSFVRHCAFNGNTAANTNCILLDGAYGNLIERNTFINYNIAVCGRAPNSPNGNGVGAGGITKVLGNTFSGPVATGSSIWSPSVAWTVADNIFEPDASGKANAIRHNTDPGPTFGCQGLVFTGNWLGDVTVDGGTWIDADGGGYFVAGNMFAGKGTTSTSALRVDPTVGCGGVSFTGNMLEGLAGVDVGSDPTKIRGDIQVFGNSLIDSQSRQMTGALATNTGDAIGLPTNGTGSSARAVAPIDPLMMPADSSVGDWIKTAQAGLWRSNFYLDNQAHQNSFLVWYVELSKGFWRLEVLRVADTDGAILTWSLDGTVVLTSDTYAGVRTVNQDSDGGSSFTVPISGLHQLRLTTATKNASSSGYHAMIHGIQLRRNVT